MSAVVLDDVSVSYEAEPVVRSINLSVGTGEWLAFIGPNGAGKTTVLRAIAGLVRHSGRITVGGDPVTALRAKELARRITLVRQDPEMPAGMTVTHYVLLGRSPHLSYFAREGTRDRRVVANVLERLSLGPLAERPMAHLSGGERQRAAIARALAQQAPVLLLDEPTSSLDVGRQQEVLELVDALRTEEGLTVIAAMHDLTLASQYADRLALVVAGRLIHCGSAKAVLTEQTIARHYQAHVRILPLPVVGRAVVPVRSESEPPSKDNVMTTEEERSSRRKPDSDTPCSPATERPASARTRAPSVVMVNTGDGKGKTTAALGTAMRAVAQGWPVCVVQFLKSGRWRVGEEQSARTLGVEWWTIGDGFTWDSRDMEKTEAVAREAWRVASEKIRSGDYRLVVLDEVTYPMNWGWISIADVVEAIRSRPPNVNVIATGRDAPDELIEVADTVAEILNRKHAYEQGIRAIRGVDF